MQDGKTELEKMISELARLRRIADDSLSLPDREMILERLIELERMAADAAQEYASLEAPEKEQREEEQRRAEEVRRILGWIAMAGSPLATGHFQQFLQQEIDVDLVDDAGRSPWIEFIETARFYYKETRRHLPEHLWEAFSEWVRHQKVPEPDVMTLMGFLSKYKNYSNHQLIPWYYGGIEICDPDKLHWSERKRRGGPPRYKNTSKGSWNDHSPHVFTEEELDARDRERERERMALSYDEWLREAASQSD
ncbi:hypothetical protein [Tranquillimonas alkanivorans]|uniref:Uncharacterized protein n=1 Tax=Tranquillimonas alkanivorans TaxID=441119 RepID=A0A1I5WBT2_9RHOB|nr:hypothetical protein [Tranquillimonas alkanivorans]SFQ17159.1 hypothetical protein SAMN04488047_14310 [Tranquillimonas alkanivorans]